MIFYRFFRLFLLINIGFQTSSNIFAMQNDENNEVQLFENGQVEMPLANFYEYVGHTAGVEHLQATNSHQRIIIPSQVYYCLIGDLQNLQHHFNNEKVNILYPIPNFRKMTLLHMACIKGNVDIAHFILSNGAIVDAINDIGQTPLHLACIYGHSELVKLLTLTYKANIDIQDDQRCSPLLYACQNGHLGMVKFLINMGASIEVCDRYKNTPLHLACSGKHTEIIELLVYHRRKLVKQNNSQDMTPLHIACQTGDLSIVKYLVNNGANISALTGDYSTPLHIACNNGHLNIVKYLIAVGAEVEMPDINGWTPLFQSCNKGHEDVVEFLIKECKVKVNIKCKKSFFTPLHVACFKGFLNIVKLLVSHGANINIKVKRDDKELTPLLFALHKGWLEIALWLITNGAELRVQEGTPLEFITEKKYILQDFIFESMIDKKEESYYIYLSQNQDPCGCCLDNFVTDTYGYKLSCGHLFHMHCLDTWSNQKKITCPMCRQETVVDVDNVSKCKQIVIFKEKDTSQKNNSNNDESK